MRTHPIVLACVGAASGAILAAACQDGSAQDASASGPAAVDAARLIAADAEPDQWMSTGRTYSEQHFSPLEAIDTENVGELGLAWFADFDTNRGQESTPLAIDGVIYVTTAWSKVLAFDAATGAPLWRYDPQVPGEWGQRACCDVVNRGAAAWNGKIYVGTIDGRLVALDAGTGEEVFDVNTIDVAQPYTITGAPRVIKDKVLIGNGGAELGVRGYVSAYDALTGALVWRFWTVPGDPALGFENDTMAMAAETWNGEWWALGGGGTVWDSMAYDPELDLLYVGVGNGSPWNQAIRSPGGGDNLFLSSIVALDPDDGSYVWHYQTTPGETWDYTATQPIVVADLSIDGVSRRVVMQAPKNGFFYVLDAATGAFISAEPFAAVNWASGIDPATGRPIENPEARYDRTGRAAVVQPSSAGAHNWHPMSFSPLTGLVYLPASNNALVYAPDTDFEPQPLASNLGIDLAAGMAELGPNATAGLATGSYLVAWDPVAQREVWRGPTAQGGPTGGTLSTSGGLVLQGSSGELVAYRATDGERLWAGAAQTGVAAAPISYEVDGEQYIAVVAGRSSGDYYASNQSRLLVFKLGGAAALPPVVPAPPRTLDPPAATASPETVARGEDVYERFCVICHGDIGTAGGLFRRGLFPELVYSGALRDAALFRAIVIEGVLSGNGMASFDAGLADGEEEAIRAYIVDAANRMKANPPAGFPR
jgi:PQQ-dependent dehydrogenase (methanol/ethanol family)